ncbi:MAG: DDE-type integrase/transposase/recombinase [Desulfosporosinus sp.]|nr:DDE-type integrase/transposase/recombinase [Desulfosporosinus sp.]
MNPPSNDERERIAQQRYEVIAPLLRPTLPRGAQKILLEKLASKMHLDAQNRLISLGKRTLERYLSDYRKFGKEGLMPKVRPDHATLKAFPQKALDEAVKIREARPELSADSIIDLLRSDLIPGVERMQVSTLNRHFRRLSKDRPALKRVVRKRYRLLNIEGAHVLWICDFWDGPYLFDDKTSKKRRLRLVALLDAYTRFIVHAEFHFNENRPCLEDALLKAILKHRLPEIFYCDNAQTFRSQHLKRIAVELGFSVKHSRAGQPQGRGRIERWFRTVAEKFEPLLKEQIDSGKIATLRDVNTFLIAWVEKRYHSRRHGTLKMTPQDALANALANHLDMSRFVDPSTVHEAFLWRETRVVSSLGAVKIYSNLYEVDETLLGKTVELRFNPYDLRRILVYYEGIFRGEARPYQMKNFTEKRVTQRQTESHQALEKAMQAIIQEHQDDIKERSGLSFAKALEVNAGE